MAYCSKCGTQLPEGVKFCPSCGAPTDPAAQTQGAQQEQAQQNAGFGAAGAQNQSAYNNTTDKINDTISKITETEDTTSQFAEADIRQNKGFAILSYFGILFLIPLFAAKNSPFARFHLNQGVVLFIANILYGVASSIIRTIFNHIPVAGSVMSILLSVIGLLFFVLMIVGIVNAASGRAKELPVIGKIRIVK